MGSTRIERRHPEAGRALPGRPAEAGRADLRALSVRADQRGDRRRHAAARHSQRDRVLRGLTDEDHRARDVRRREPAALTSAAATSSSSSSITDDGVEGLGEVYGATFGPHLVARMIEDVCERARDRRRPVPRRAALARRLRPGLLRPARHLAARRAERHRDGVLGHRRQGRRASRSTSCSAGASTSACAATRTSTASRATRRDVYLDPDLAGRARRRSTWRAASPRSSSTRRATTRRSTRASRGSRSSTARERYLRTMREAVGRPLRPAVRDARPVHRRPARSGSPGASRRSTRSGSRSRRRPSCRRRWRG